MAQKETVRATPQNRRVGAFTRIEGGLRKMVFYRHLRAVAPRDPELLRAASRVTQDKSYPSVLFHPAILLRLARRTLRRESIYSSCLPR